MCKIVFIVVALLLLPLLRAVVNNPEAFKISHPTPTLKVKEVAGLLVSSTFFHLQKNPDF